MKIDELPLLSQLIYHAETGGLDNITQEKIDEVLSSYTLSRYSKEEAPKGVKDTFDSIHNFLNRLNNFFSIPEKTLKSKYDLMSKMKKLEASLPQGCDITDDEDVIKFAKKLFKPYYNDSQAGDLLGVQRQTVKDWKVKKYLGLAGYIEKKRNVISRDALLNFYRDWKGLRWNF